jgi:hypothetical protein
MSTAQQSPLASVRDDQVGMEFLESVPRKAVTVYLPLGIFLFVLLFPFYWMAITSFKPNEELLSREGNPFWVIKPTLAHFNKLLFETSYPEWLWNTVVVSVVATFASLVASVMAAYAIERLRFTGAKQIGLSIFLAYLVPPSILFIPLAAIVFNLGLYDSRWALILTYPTFLIPFSTWLLMGLVVRIEDRAGRRGDRAGRRRRLPLGLVDGRRPARLATGGLRVLVLRRVLRVGVDGVGEGIDCMRHVCVARRAVPTAQQRSWCSWTKT